MRKYVPSLPTPGQRVEYSHKVFSTVRGMSTLAGTASLAFFIIAEMTDSMIPMVNSIINAVVSPTFSTNDEEEVSSYSYKFPIACLLTAAVIVPDVFIAKLKFREDCQRAVEKGKKIDERIRRNKAIKALIETRIWGAISLAKINQEENRAVTLPAEVQAHILSYVTTGDISPKHDCAVIEKKSKDLVGAANRVVSNRLT